MLNTPTQTAAAITDFKSLVNALIYDINLLIPLLFGLAFIAFAFGVIRYIYSANTEKIQDARKFIIFGIIGIAVMLSVWALALTVKGLFFPTANLPLGGTSGGSSGFNLDPHIPNCPSGEIYSTSQARCIPDPGGFRF